MPNKFNCNSCANDNCLEHCMVEADRNKSGNKLVSFRKSPKVTKCRGFVNYHRLGAQEEIRATRGLERVKSISV